MLNKLLKGFNQPMEITHIDDIVCMYNKVYLKEINLSDQSTISHTSSVFLSNFGHRRWHTCILTIGRRERDWIHVVFIHSLYMLEIWKVLFYLYVYMLHYNIIFSLLIHCVSLCSVGDTAQLSSNCPPKNPFQPLKAAKFVPTISSKCSILLNLK